MKTKFLRGLFTRRVVRTTFELVRWGIVDYIMEDAGMIVEGKGRKGEGVVVYELPDNIWKPTLH